LSTLTFVGLGLYSELGITLEGLEEVKKAGHVFAEFYTSHMAGINLSNLERMTGKRIEILSRRDVEEEAESRILRPAKSETCAFLTPGDPSVATTHVALRLKAEKEGIKTSIIHAASISSAIAGTTGLQSYKFGRTVTIPFNSTSTAETPYERICENRLRGLHTLALLDIDSENKRYMTIPEALTQLLDIEEQIRGRIARYDSTAIGVARIGSPDSVAKADTVRNLIEANWGGPPQCLVFLGKLHFMETEALEILCGARRELLEDRP
jgi:diphthine synthase